jgi:pimeloyl-ACP methyl ester carboxylesterase
MTGPSQGSTDRPTDKSIDPTLIRFKPGQRREDGHPVRFCTIHGYRRAFVCVGTGPALLLIHGIGDSSDTWRPVLDQLARHHTIVAPDLLGHGRSEKPRADYSVAAYANGMRDLLSVLEIDRVTVIGHSLGGGVAGQFAYQFPERCERLVLVGSGGVGRSISPFLRLAAVPGIEAMMPLFGLPPVRMAGHVAADVLRRFSTALGRDTEELLAVFDALPDTSARRAILRTLRSGVDWRGQVITMLDRAYLAEGLPTLLVWGRHDAVIPLGHGRLAHAAMPGSELEIFDDAGHFPHHADPDRFADLVSDFVRRTTPAPFNQEEWRQRLRRGRQAVEAEPAETDLELMALSLSPLPGAH